MAQGDVYRVTANFSGPQGQLRQWVWHIEQEATGSPSAVEIIDAIVTLLVALWALLESYIDSNTNGETVELALWDSGLSQFDTIGVGDITALVGGKAGGNSPGNVAPYITFFTELSRSRGKKFLFDVDRASVDDGLIAGAMLAAMIVAGDLWNNAITPGGVSHRPGNFNRTTATFLTWIPTVIAVGAFTGSQYRRLPGRGA